VLARAFTRKPPNIIADERTHAAALFDIHRRGEVIAARCATVQADLPCPPPLRRFFVRQARQERFHARVFDSAIRWVRPKGPGPAPAAAAMGAYQRLLDCAAERRDVGELLLGNQIILEALGEVELEKIDQGLERRGLGFKRLRRIILAQEQAHHATGEAALEALIESNGARRGALRTRAADYLALIERIFDDTAPLFEYFAQDVGAHRRRFWALLPPWIRAR
jgi:hypothetical protein